MHNDDFAFASRETQHWPPKAVAPLLGNEVDLWWLDADIGAELPRRQRTDLLLRSVLSTYLACSPEALTFGREDKGRPFLSQGGPDFNLSDTRGGTVIAIAARGRIGIDLERLDRRPPAQALAERWFSPHESESLATLAEDHARAACFVRLWTAKEASCKATGTGIFGWLDQWVFDPGSAQPALLQLPEAAGKTEDWQFRRIRPSTEHTAVLAVNGFMPRLRTLWQISSQQIHSP